MGGVGGDFEDGRIDPARGDGKSLLSIVRYCKELGMTDDEIRELFEKAIKNMGGTVCGVVE